MVVEAMVGAPGERYTNGKSLSARNARGSDDLLEHLPYVIASAFSGDDDAGVQD